MRIIEYSNIGRRAQNQDFVLSKEIGENKAIYIVADGMGGYSDGDIAAKVAAEEIANHIAKGKTIPESVLDANAELSKTIRERGVSKMGCCFAGIEVDGYIGNIFWIGDCRVYLFRDGKQIFVTQDHTMITEMEKHGKVTYSQRERYGHIVSRGFMGSPKDIADVSKLELKPGDEIVICSDGLHKSLPIDVLVDMINKDTFALKDRNDDFDDNHSFIYVKI
ncbi:MAG: serine/threonine-protein phosphatase [Muribaculaceae bacterium]|jgi:serine/threonine protein phosphatase PrpC|uniref:PP2C family protein-serine/threonine phosphatase n=1 Tax=uncultured Duncaniella sp. TaxID=2768039 RepID=UPI0026F40576|nr:protein phosphatase 2C domain-containing protein [uncultured Duncaniella sp.]MCI9030056.1 serine/threonine-protein phosphatase [Muribaculaceae bacterium]